jgi:hypothetical protein
MIEGAGFSPIKLDSFYEDFNNAQTPETVKPFELNINKSISNVESSQPSFTPPIPTKTQHTPSMGGLLDYYA